MQLVEERADLFIPLSWSFEIKSQKHNSAFFSVGVHLFISQYKAGRFISSIFFVALAAFCLWSLGLMLCLQNGWRCNCNHLPLCIHRQSKLNAFCQLLFPAHKYWRIKVQELTFSLWSYLKCCYSQKLQAQYITLSWLYNYTVNMYCVCNVNDELSAHTAHCTGRI